MFQLVKDELVVLGDKPSDGELLCIALNGLSKKWSMFFQEIYGLEKLLYWDILRSDIAQEELRLRLVNGTSSNRKAPKLEKEKESVSIPRMRKVNKVPSKAQGLKGEKKNKDLLKVKFFGCGQLGHYVIQCPSQKKGQKGKQTIAQCTLRIYL